MPPRKRIEDEAGPQVGLSAAAQAVDAEAVSGPRSRDIEQAAQKRRAAAFPDADRAAREIDALLVERRGYVQRGKTDRVEQVDEQIELRGGTPPARES
jgi:hypothetical protein